MTPWLRSLPQAIGVFLIGEDMEQDRFGRLLNVPTGSWHLWKWCVRRVERLEPLNYTRRAKAITDMRVNTVGGFMAWPDHSRLTTSCCRPAGCLGAPVLVAAAGCALLALIILVSTTRELGANKIR
jgi:hypothetical protein